MSTGKLTYKLVGFDPKTGKKMAAHAIPVSQVKLAKKNAGFPHPFKDFAGDKPLTVRQVEFIAEQIGAHLDMRLRYFLSPVAVGGSVQVAHA